jgi:hypothetical protein
VLTDVVQQIFWVSVAVWIAICAVVVALALKVPKQGYRYTTRTLLIAATLVAMLLGAIVYAIR